MKDEKVSKLQELLEGVAKLFKGEEIIEEAKEEIVIEEPVIEKPVIEELMEEKPEVEEIIEELAAEEKPEEDVVEKETKVSEEIEKSAEIIEIQKAYEAKIEELTKQLEQEKIEKQEQIEKSEKEELMSIVKSQMEFSKGNPEENCEMLLSLKKSVLDEQFDWILSGLKKQSEVIEKGLEEHGKDTSNGVEDLTAHKKLEKIAKQLVEQKEVGEEESYRKACELNPDLASLAITEYHKI